MSRRVTFYNSSYASAPPDYSDIFGANLYDWWDFKDAATISETGGLINSITSKGSNAAVFASSGTARPSLITSPILGSTAGQFDGVSEFMEVAGSLGMYNFLHNSAGTGAVIIVANVTSNTGSSQLLIGNNLSSTPVIGYGLQTQASKYLASFAARGVGGTRAVFNNSSPTAMYADYTSVNVFMDLVDAGNGSFAYLRSTINSNFGADIQNNTQAFAASNSNASNLFSICRNPASSGNYASIDITEILVLDTTPTPTQLTQLQNRLEYEYGTFPIS